MHRKKRQTAAAAAGSTALAPKTYKIEPWHGHGPDSIWNLPAPPYKAIPILISRPMHEVRDEDLAIILEGRMIASQSSIAGRMIA